jgi:hypothetical protein
MNGLENQRSNKKPPSNLAAEAVALKGAVLKIILHTNSLE